MYNVIWEMKKVHCHQWFILTHISNIYGKIVSRVNHLLNIKQISRCFHQIRYEKYGANYYSHGTSFDDEFR